MLVLCVLNVKIQLWMLFAVIVSQNINMLANIIIEKDQRQKRFMQGRILGELDPVNVTPRPSVDTDNTKLNKENYGGKYRQSPVEKANW